MNKADFKNLKNVIGPGIMMAGAAIGVSHLIQSTRAGADYGFSLWWVLVLACLTKYPFLEFGPRYTAATGENLLLGYKKIGKGAFPAFTLLTGLTMFIILASVTLVTAGLAEHLFRLNISMWSWSLIIIIVCVAFTLIGNYPAIDRIMKIIMVILLVFTFAAVLFVFGTPAPATALSHTPPSYLTPAGIAFIIAFMGWMPIPLDSSVWQSIWAKEKFKQTGYQPTVREALFDYKLGFYGAGIVAVFFFLLGVFIMFGQRESFPAGSVAFSAELVDLYGQTLGKWSRPIISIAAFVAMFSTTLAVVDIYPRVIKEVTRTHFVFERKIVLKEAVLKRVYWFFLFLVPAVALFILTYIKSGFTHLIDFAAGLSFLSAPIIGYYNLKLMTSKHMPEYARPKKWYVIMSWSFLVFLIIFSLIYIYWRYIFAS